MIVDAYWDQECAGWFFEVNGLSIRLPYKEMEKRIKSKTTRHVKVKLCVGTEVTDYNTHCHFGVVSIVK